MSPSAVTRHAGSIAFVASRASVAARSRSVRGTLNELDHIRKVVARKTTMPVALNEKPEGGQGEG